MQDKITKIIYDWGGENFGTQEAEDPSWDIHALAEEIAKHKYEIYHDIERQYLTEDCEMVAENNAIELTEKEKQIIVDEYMNSEAYVDCHAEDWLWFIKQVKGE